MKQNLKSLNLIRDFPGRKYVVSITFLKIFEYTLMFIIISFICEFPFRALKTQFQQLLFKHGTVTNFFFVYPGK